MSEPSLEELKFHWEKWRAEVRAFWGRAVLVNTLLIVSLMFQFSWVSVKFPEVDLTSGQNSLLFRLAINLLSWFLFAFLCFRFVDLLRHRVPEHMEEIIHTNLLPNPLHGLVGPEQLDLRKYDRILYLAFPAYGVGLGLILAVAFVHVFAQQVRVVWLSVVVAGLGLKAHHAARDDARDEGEIPDREGNGNNKTPFSQRENDPGIEKGKAENERLGLTPKEK